MVDERRFKIREIVSAVGTLGNGYIVFGPTSGHEQPVIRCLLKVHKNETVQSILFELIPPKNY